MRADRTVCPYQVVAGDLRFFSKKGQPVPQTRRIMIDIAIKTCLLSIFSSDNEVTKR